MTDSPARHTFAEPPATLGKAAFVKRFGGIYEHSSWVAERTWLKGIDASHAQISELAGAMARVLAEASQDEKLQLIRAHPDLAGKAALKGDLTDDSTDEQASAGLDQCTAEELSRFQQLNDAYKARFDMPFIMAVRGSNRHLILAGFEERLMNEPAVEFERALAEINRIALLRLQTLTEPAYPRDMIGYGNQPPKARWPEKARIAVQFVINYEERDHMHKAIEVHTRVTGQRPTGWYLGRCSPNTHRMVAEEGGFVYNADSYADDLPYWDAAFGDTPQLIVPYTLDANDMRFASPQGFNAGDQFFNYLKDSFDTLYAEGVDTPRMMSIGLHCRLVGRPGRIASLARFLDYIKSYDDAWVTRRIDIAEHWQKQHPASN